MIDLTKDCCFIRTIENYSKVVISIMLHLGHLFMNKYQVMTTEKGYIFLSQNVRLRLINFLFFIKLSFG